MTVLYLDVCVLLVQMLVVTSECEIRVAAQVMLVPWDSVKVHC